MGNLPSHVKALIEERQGIMVDLGCGQNKEPGWVGIDIRPWPGVDIVHDLETYPWPLPDDSVLVMRASHLVEHVDPSHGNFLRWMDEAWRVMKEDRQFIIICPYAPGFGFFQDPTHCNPINEATWGYFDPLHPSMLYTIYRPRPWKIEDLNWVVGEWLQVILRKRREDASYHPK